MSSKLRSFSKCVLFLLFQKRFRSLQKCVLQLFPHPLFITSAHLVIYRGAETGMAALLLILTHLPVSSFRRSELCSEELKH